MRILFVCDGYYPVPNAAGYCTLQIINYLKHNNMHCDIINITTDPNVDESVIHHDSIIYNIVDDYNADISKFYDISVDYMLLIIARKLYERFNTFKIKKVKYNNIINILNRVGQHYDVIIPVVSDFNNGYGVMIYCKANKIPYILYQVDPIGTNYTQTKYRHRLRQIEKELYENASFIFTTPMIKKEKVYDGNYDIKKIIAVEFPNVTNLCTKKTVNAQKIVCSFCGNLINGVRDCSYVLDLFSIINNPNIIIQFAGTGQENIIRKYSENKLHGCIIHKGKLNRSECIIFMQESDFLINIGNQMTNQVPSKLFDYISIGLSIINICKNCNCPTLPYLKKYGLALNLFETTDSQIKIEQANELYHFIMDNCGVRKSYDSIKGIFYENTPEYVGNQFISALMKIGNFKG